MSRWLLLFLLVFTFSAVLPHARDELRNELERGACILSAPSIPPAEGAELIKKVDMATWHARLATVTWLGNQIQFLPRLRAAIEEFKDLDFRSRHTLQSDAVRWQI